MLERPRSMQLVFIPKNRMRVKKQKNDQLKILYKLYILRA